MIKLIINYLPLVLESCLVFAFLLLLFLSRREIPSIERKGLFGILDKMSCYLNRRVLSHRRKTLRGVYLERNLRTLNPGEDVPDLLRQYCEQKISTILLIILVGFFFGIVLYAKTATESELQAGKVMNRPSVTEEERVVRLEDENTGLEIELAISPRSYTSVEIEKLYAAFVANLLTILRADNPDFEHIYRDVKPVREVEGYPFSVEWEGFDFLLIGTDGHVAAVSNPQNIVLTAKISYLDFAKMETIALTVIPEPLTKEEERKKKLETLLEETEAETRESEEFELPTEYEGERFFWKIKNADYSLAVMAVSILLAIVVYFVRDSDVDKDVKKRKERMLALYPQIVQKLALYIGAGMTLRSAFIQIAEHYEHSRSPTDSREAIYEEMLISCRELQAGISETRVYENWGKRTDTQEYIRLSTLLSQNLRKGSNSLVSRLAEESEASMKAGLSRLRRMGEEATTKLLFPMMLMLFVVMVMIMVPAFIGLGI